MPVLLLIYLFHLFASKHAVAPSLFDWIKTGLNSCKPRTYYISFIFETIKLGNVIKPTLVWSDEGDNKQRRMNTLICTRIYNKHLSVTLHQIRLHDVIWPEGIVECTHTKCRAERLNLVLCCWQTIFLPHSYYWWYTQHYVEYGHIKIFKLYQRQGRCITKTPNHSLLDFR